MNEEEEDEAGTKVEEEVGEDDEDTLNEFVSGAGWIVLGFG